MTFREALRDYAGALALPTLAGSLVIGGIFYLSTISNLKRYNPPTRSIGPSTIERPVDQKSPLDYFEEGARFGVWLQYQIGQQRSNPDQQESLLETKVRGQSQD